MTFGKLTNLEISSQSQALSEALKQLEVQKEWVDRYIGHPAFDEIIFIGSGSSYYQALTMASTYRKWTGRNASAFPSSEIYLFREHAVVPGKKVLLVGVSRSGESSEVILAFESVKGLPDWTVCGITCYEKSKLAAISECLVSPLGKEHSTVMTKSFSSMTFMMQAASALAAKADMSLFYQIVETSETVVPAADVFIRNLVKDHTFNKYIYLGMGPLLGISHEACLKIKEMSYVWTENYNTLEFRHGPKSIVDPGTFICLLVSEHARAYELKVVEEMKDYGAYILLVTTRKGADTKFADAVFEIGGANVTDEARSILYLPPMQYLGYYTALKLNVDPDTPRNLTQVVKLN